MTANEQQTFTNLMFVRCILCMFALVTGHIISLFSIIIFLSCFVFFFSLSLSLSLVLIS